MAGSSGDTGCVTRTICVVAKAIVVSVNHRLAPEWPSPTGLHRYVWCGDPFLDGFENLVLFDASEIIRSAWLPPVGHVESECSS
jgi:hypothetical protein